MRRAILCLLLLAACRRAPAVHEVQAQKAIDPEQGNLLRLERGAVVIDRTGEATLEQSAELLIDGEPTSIWSSPPFSTRESVTFALPARTRITSVGATTTKQADVSVAKLQFEVSTDGVAWRTLTTLPLAPNDTAQFAEVQPAEASFLRVMVVEARGTKFAALAGVYVRGTELEPAHPGPIAGCWSINGEPARFEQNGNRVTGTVGKAKVEGTADGRVIRLNWTDPPNHGVLRIAVTPDGKSLSGMLWYEVIWPANAAAAPFGVRVECDRLGSPSQPF